MTNSTGFTRVSSQVFRNFNEISSLSDLVDVKPLEEIYAIQETDHVLDMEE